MSIALLCSALEREINKELKVLMRQAQDFKEDFDKQAPEEILNHHIAILRETYTRLKPAEFIILGNNPQLIEFFETIKNLKTKKSRKKPDGNKTDS